MLIRLLREALWAPAAVTLAALILGRLPGIDLWWLMHILGGTAVAYCYLRVSELLGRRYGLGHPGVRYVLAFALACSTALAWEFAEFGLDELTGSALQEGLMDTMSDLMLSVCGAAAYLAWHALGARRDQIITALTPNSKGSDAR
jgi:hypothetical protein